ncbi:MAG: 2-dehydropantoate 2-reductase [Thermodesulfobacteriota bacterium]|nr:2-dehydropantoate 2-reductase [Thermodesulfobacteriota bacterium]
MKIIIVGPGAMGSLFACFLSEAGEDVWLLDKHQERVDKINKDGLIVEGISGGHKVFVNQTTQPEDIGEADLIIVCVKAYDTKRTASDILPLIGEDTSVLTVQNGFGNVEMIAKVVGQKKVIGGTTSQGATVLGMGHIRHAGKGDTTIGELDGTISKRVDGISKVLSSAGIETKITQNVEGLIWSKLIINVGINALTAVLRLRNGELVEYEWSREVLRASVEEGLLIVKARGIELAYDDPIKRVEDVCKATATNVSSMLQDVLKAKKTEIDYINGAIVNEGERLRIPVPVNRTLTSLVKTIESSYEKRF